MIVEFVGTPGSGKTSLLPVVSEYFTAQGYNAYSVLDGARPFAGRTLAGHFVNRWVPSIFRRPLLWQIFYQSSTVYRRRFHAKHLQLMESVFDFQAERPISRADKEHVLDWFVHMTGCYEFFKAYAGPKDVLIFDEGFIHRVVQLFASENEIPDHQFESVYLELVPRPDLVVHPIASHELCEQRVYARGLWERFQTKTPEETSRFIANADNVVNFAVNWIKQKGWPLIEVENGLQDVSIAQATLRDALKKLSLFQSTPEFG